MIDTSTYKILHKERMFLERRRTPSDRMISESLGPQGSEIYLFPKTIKGYNLRRKKWGKWPTEAAKPEASAPRLCSAGS